MSTPIEKLKIEYLEYLEIEKERSINTVRNYDLYLSTFFKQADITQPSQITLPIVKRFRMWLNRKPRRNHDDVGTLSAATQNYYMIALRNFLKYCSKMDVVSLAPEKIELGKTVDHEVLFLEAAEIERLLKAPLQTSKTSTCSITELRDAAILETLFSTGLRVGELTGLRREIVGRDAREFTVRGKGRKLRIVFLTVTARQAINRYLDARSDVSPWLFVRHDKASGTPSTTASVTALTSRSIQRLIHKYALIAGITKPITPHTMRHSFATDMLTNGADIRSVQSLLGHASITTTQIYTHVTNPQLKKIHQTFHGKQRKQQS